MIHPRRAPRLLLLPLMAALLTSLPGLTIARDACASEPPPCEVCMTQRAVERCAQDAVQVDAARADAVRCQRQLDAQAGREEALRAQLEEDRARAEAAYRAQVQAEQEVARRPRWRAVVIGVAAGVVGGAVAWELIR